MKFKLVLHGPLCAQQGGLICNDWDYLLKGGWWELIVWDMRRPQVAAGTACIPNLVLDMLAIDVSNAWWIPVLVFNNYTRCGLPGAGLATVLKALEGQ